MPPLLPPGWRDKIAAVVSKIANGAWRESRMAVVVELRFVPVLPLLRTLPLRTLPLVLLLLLLLLLFLLLLE